jgi:hypothetical protein
VVLDESPIWRERCIIGFGVLGVIGFILTAMDMVLKIQNEALPKAAAP